METHAEAVEQFGRHVRCEDAAGVVGSLSGGLTLLRDSLYTRVRHEVESNLGADSMLLPVSHIKTEKATKKEIELYQVVESAEIAGERGYVSHDDDWYLPWLTRLRLGEVPAETKTARRLNHYVSRTSSGRRLAFTNSLARALPESTRAPLVLFRLVPLAVRLATAVAFGDHRGAAEDRDRQRSHLPGIADCPRCHGEVLENGEQCLECGNPLWSYPWLVAAD